LVANNWLFSAPTLAILVPKNGQAVTDQRSTRIPQFFLTPGGPCPYLPGRIERKVFARLGGNLAQPLSEALTHSGFRRSQSIAYRPACEGCAACVSVRIKAGLFGASRSQKRILKRGGDLIRSEVKAEATREQFALLRTYLDSRHPGGGMSDMGLFDYVAMVEETPVDTHIVEYRRPDGTLIACGLSDRLKDGLSMVYSFFHPGEEARSLGTYMILDHVRAAQAQSLPYVYLGYWVRGSDKMDYKVRFQPLEALGQNGWEELIA
jgi:arginyl-tRNA--protein-N-Asp/Glu arginylyltransferase